MVKKTISKAERTALLEVYLAVKEHSKQRSGYFDLFGYILFIALFMAVLLAQRPPATSFGVETILKDIMLGTPATSFPDGSFTGGLSSRESFYDWFQSAIMPAFVDDVCGNGVCEASEFPRYRGYGCDLDCGEYSSPPGTSGSKLTDVNVYIEMKKRHGKFLDKIIYWNLCTNVESYEFCYFQEDMVLHDGSYPNSTSPEPMVSNFSSTLQLLDGEWRLTYTAPNGGLFGEIYRLQPLNSTQNSTLTNSQRRAHHLHLS